MKMQYILGMLVLLMQGLTACSDDETPLQEAWEVTAVLTTQGLGDLGYCDRMYMGLCEVREALTDCDVIVRAPSNTDEAGQMIDDWANATPVKGKHRMLILCQEDYGDLLHERGLQTSDANTILLLESHDESLPVYTRYIPLYGACYAVGRMCKETLEGTDKHAAVAMANPNDVSIEEGRQGFVQGAAEEGVTVETYYLDSTSDPYGYSSAYSLYNLCYDINDSVGFLLPLAGGTNNGVYRYGREEKKNVIWTVAMDSDQSYTSYTCGYGIMKLIDQLVLDFCTNWQKGNEQPLHSLCGLASGYIVVEEGFDGPNHPWAQNLEEILQEAVPLESEKLKVKN